MVACPLLTPTEVSRIYGDRTSHYSFQPTPYPHTPLPPLPLINFQGHDTTTSALLWTIHLVGKHPEVQAKLQDEADSLFGKNQ